MSVLGLSLHKIEKQEIWICEAAKYARGSVSVVVMYELWITVLFFQFAQKNQTLLCVHTCIQTHTEFESSALYTTKTCSDQFRPINSIAVYFVWHHLHGISCISHINV